jgi:phosphoribosylformylglycinamidine synthase
MDPQGQAILEAAQHLGLQEAKSIRTGRYFEVVLEAPDDGTARSKLSELCEKLLANPVIETYEIALAPLGSRETHRK